MGLERTAHWVKAVSARRPNVNETSAWIAAWPEGVEPSLRRGGHSPIDKRRGHVQQLLRAPTQLRGRRVCRRIVLVDALAFPRHGGGHVAVRAEGALQLRVAELEDLGLRGFAQAVEGEMSVIRQCEVDLQVTKLH